MLGTSLRLPREPQDFIYCDPPYHGTFDGYDASRFGEDKHRRLRDTVLKVASPRSIRTRIQC